jgi:hypothetical protein
MPTKSGDSIHRSDTQAQLDGFIDRYDPPIAALIRAALSRVRAALPHCVEFVYDNHYALVIGFGPTEKPSQALFSIAAYPDHVSFCFLHGASLSDPQRILRGSGNRVRHIRLDSVKRLDGPAVQQFIVQSLAMSSVPFTALSRRTIVKSIAANPRPRRPPAR